MADTGPDIIIVAKVNNSGHVYGTSTLPPGTHFYTPQTVSTDGSDGPDADLAYLVYIRVRINKSGNREAAERAARTLAQSIVNLNNFAQSHSNISVTVNGKTFSLYDFIDAMKNTDWIVTDNPNPGSNGGVGASSYNPSGGRNTDIISYFAIDGAGSYADALYTNNEGMSALILHELFHLSPQGYQYLSDSLDLWRNESPSTNNAANFYTSDFASNLEKLANDAMIAIANAAGIDINLNGSPVIPGRPDIQHGVNPSLVHNP